MHLSYSLDCVRVSLSVSGLFAVIAAPRMDVLLLCLKGEVNSAAYCAILISPEFLKCVGITPHKTTLITAPQGLFNNIFKIVHLLKLLKRFLRTTQITWQKGTK